MKNKSHDIVTVLPRKRNMARFVLQRSSYIEFLCLKCGIIYSYHLFFNEKDDLHVYEECILKNDTSIEWKILYKLPDCNEYMMQDALG